MAEVSGAKPGDRCTLPRGNDLGEWRACCRDASDESSVGNMTRRQWVLVAGAVVVSCGGAALGYRAMREAPRMSSCIQDFRLAHDATCLLLQNGRVHCFGNPKKIGKELVWDPETEVFEDPEPYPVQTDVRFSAIDVGPYVA